MYIETPRMIIRDFTPEDAADLHDIFGDDETMENCEPAYDFEKTKEFLTSFCIGRKGYGKVATKLVLDIMKQDGKYSKVVLCYIEGNDAAKKLYENFGFVEIDRDEDEIIMELILNK